MILVSVGPKLRPEISYTWLPTVFMSEDPTTEFKTGSEYDVKAVEATDAWVPSSSAPGACTTHFRSLPTPAAVS